MAANLKNSPSNSRISGHSSQISVKNFHPEEDDEIILERLHAEAVEFLQKHFSGYGTKDISVTTFIDNLLAEFSNLWEDNQARAVLP